MSPVQAGRPAVRTAAFAAFALYGVLNWADLSGGQWRGRLLALLALALAVVVAGPPLLRRYRRLTWPVGVLAALAAVAVAGVPVSWVTHLRVVQTSRGIGNGFEALPGVFVPYVGSNHWVLVVMTLGAAVLLLDAAFVMAFAPAGLGHLRRAVAALPLVALAVIPPTMIRSRHLYLDGLVVFVLLAAFMWCERVRGRQLGAAVIVCAAAGGVAIAAAPALEPGRPWLDYQSLTGSLTAGATETFDWAQRYGPLDWPRSGKPVLAVTAGHADYWKAQDLDGFDGREWTEGIVAGAQLMPAVSPAARRRWTQRITVTIRNMRTTDVIGAGTFTAPAQLARATPGAAPGTWSVGTPLGPGSRYETVAYSPHPSPAALARVTGSYAEVPSGYRTLGIPVPAPPGPGATVDPVVQIAFAPFGSAATPQVVGGPPGPADATDIVQASPYGPVYALAQRLARQAGNPSDYVRLVLRWLGHGYRYSEDPPASAYPLVSFLLDTRSGYCQQFAGAMALLLRMGGVPARVAVGFTPGSYDARSRAWVSTDLNAHAWVEAWFPQYGWVRFDSTPAADPALQDTVISAPNSQASSAPPPAPTPRSPAGTPHAPAPHRPASGAPARAAGGGGGSAPLVAILPPVVAVLLAALGFVLTRPLVGPEAALAELERAFVRSRRPLEPGVTLAQLERRLHDWPGAAAYVRALRQARFGGARRAPSRAGRRALRTYLATGLGATGRLRALWALPPRRGFGRWRGA